MTYVTYALLAVFAVLWMFVVYRFLRAMAHFSASAMKRVEAIRVGGEQDAASENAATARPAPVPAPASASETTDQRPHDAP